MVPSIISSITSESQRCGHFGLSWKPSPVICRSHEELSNHPSLHSTLRFVYICARCWADIVSLAETLMVPPVKFSIWDCKFGSHSCLPTNAIGAIISFLDTRITRNTCAMAARRNQADFDGSTGSLMISVCTKKKSAPW